MQDKINCKKESYRLSSTCGAPRNQTNVPPVDAHVRRQLHLSAVARCSDSYCIFANTVIVCSFPPSTPIQQAHPNSKSVPCFVDSSTISDVTNYTRTNDVPRAHRCTTAVPGTRQNTRNTHGMPNVLDTKSGACAKQAKHGKGRGRQSRARANQANIYQVRTNQVRNK